MEPRGIRNNNPGNIDRNAVSWQGMSTMQDDPRFIRFDEPKWGIRAIMKIIKTYDEKYELTTIRKIIYRWAPPEENATDSYVAAVADHVGIDADEELGDLEGNILLKITQAIVVHENGNPPDNTPPFWYDDSVYEAAVALA